jgi:hypothetical protein
LLTQLRGQHPTRQSHSILHSSLRNFKFYSYHLLLIKRYSPSKPKINPKSL